MLGLPVLRPPPRLDAGLHSQNGCRGGSLAQGWAPENLRAGLVPPGSRSAGGAHCCEFLSTCPRGCTLRVRSACGRDSRTHLIPVRAVPGLLLPAGSSAARLRTFPRIDLNDASRLTSYTCGFQKKSFFVKNYLSWHKIIGKYHGYLNKTHQK